MTDEKCYACAFEAEMGTEEVPHPLDEKLHRCGGREPHPAAWNYDVLENERLKGRQGAFDSMGRRCHACDQVRNDVGELPDSLPMCAQCAKAHRMGYRCGEMAAEMETAEAETPEAVVSDLEARIARYPNRYAKLLVAFSDAACAALDEFHGRTEGIGNRSRAMRQVWNAYLAFCRAPKFDDTGGN